MDDQKIILDVTNLSVQFKTPHGLVKAVNNINFVFPYDESNIPIYDAKEDEGSILSAFTIDDESTYDHDDAISRTPPSNRRRTLRRKKNKVRT